jgi:type I restriction enzyme R subunit
MTAPYKEGDFERAIEAYLTETAPESERWLKGDPDNYDQRLAFDPVELELFVAETQAASWEKLVSTRFGGDQSKARPAFREAVAKMLDSQGVLRCLRSGVPVLGIDFALAYFRPESGLTQSLNERYAANRITLTRQLAYSTKNDNTLDLAMFVNGIPVATAELKNKLTGQTAKEDARKQYRKDREPSEPLFAKRTLVHFAADTDEVYLTTELAGEDTVFLPFNQGHDGGKGNPPPAAGDKYRTSYLWEEVWQRDNWLDILRRFVHVAKSDSGQSVIFPRYHQWRAVVDLVGHARQHGAGNNYLAMHSAGSGKSNTIAWLAHRLAVLHRDDKAVFDKVIIVTDRRALDQQLGDTVFQFEHQTGLVQKTRGGSSELAAALMSSSVRIVISTLQKFPFVIEKLDELPERNYAVIIDEAHSSQGGEAAKSLREALGAAAAKEIADEHAEPGEGDEADEVDEASAAEVQDLLAASVQARGKQPNLSYFAFTATPTRRTRELFGTPQVGATQKGPFSLYSMRQAIEEGFILDVLKYYTPYSVLWKVASKAKADKTVEKSKATQAIARYVNQHPNTLDEKAHIIVEHFHGTVRNKIDGKAKAMVVCPSREQAVLTYFAIKKVVEDEGYTDCQPLVAFSDSVPLGDQDYTEAGINGFGEGELPRKFGWVPSGDSQKDKGHDLFRILVVAEKHQTGFDQPLLHTMYVDKKLVGIRAVQTLSRLNRIHPGKDDTFVLDFVNDPDSIRTAFEEYYETALTYVTDPMELYVAHGNLTGFAVIDPADEQTFAEVFLGSDPDDPTAHARLISSLEPAVERFGELAEDDQKNFRAALAKYVDIYAFLAQAIAFTDERLEATFLYARHLRKALPSVSGGTIDLGGDIVLTHLRIEAGNQVDVSPTASGQVSDAESGDVAPVPDPAMDVLAHIIQDLNNRHGSELGGSDRIILQEVLGGMGEDSDLVQKAKANSKDNFLLVFSGPFEEEVMKTENTNRAFFERFFSDEEFRNDLIKGVGAEFHRRHGGESMAA